MTGPPGNDAAPRPGEDGGASGDDAVDGMSASCPVCWLCGAGATKTVVLPNERRSTLIAIGACAKHVIGALAELNNLQQLAFKLGERP